MSDANDVWHIPPERVNPEPQGQELLVDYYEVTPRGDGTDLVPPVEDAAATFWACAELFDIPNPDGYSWVAGGSLTPPRK